MWLNARSGAGVCRPLMLDRESAFWTRSSRLLAMPEAFGNIDDESGGYFDDSFTCGS